MSRARRLAIEALAELADLPSQEWSIAEKPTQGTTGDHAFLQQIVNRLGREGIVPSKKERGGGYQLARSPRSLMVRTVVGGIDGRGVKRCMLNSTPCDGRRRCPLEPAWHPLHDLLLSFLEAETIESIAEHNRERWTGSI